MERIFIDFVGPLVRSRNGNIAILVVLDGFSKFVSLYPVRKIAADVVVRTLVEKFFPYYGVPQCIVSDNVTVFKSRAFYNACFSWGIQHVTTSPYYPQASQVERFNRNLKAALTIFHHSQHICWDENLPSLSIAFNSAWHESTGMTPAKLFLGREMMHPLEVKWELFDLDLQKDREDVQRYWEEALRNLKKARDRVAQRYNSTRSRADFKIGDLVLVRLHPLSSKLQQHSAKLENKWSVPLTIAKFLSGVTVQLANPDTGVIVRKAHVSQIKRYFNGD
jgi:transposase InsO family protein